MNPNTAINKKNVLFFCSTNSSIKTVPEYILLILNKHNFSICFVNSNNLKPFF